MRDTFAQNVRGARGVPKLIKKSRAIPSGTLFSVSLVADVGEKSELTRTLDSDSELALMLCTASGHTARENLCSLGDERLCALCALEFLEIDLIDLVCAELADLLAAAHRRLSV